MLDKPAVPTFALDVPGDERRDSMQLRQIVDNASVAMYVKDLDGTYLYVNRAFERLTGLPRESIVGRQDAGVFPANAQAFQRHDRRVIEQRRAIDFEEVIDLPDGVRTYLSHKFPLIDHDGDAYAVCGISTDITDRKRAEEALRTAATAVSTDGDAIFRDLTVAIARILDVDVAFIAVFTDEGRERMRTLAAMLDGKLLRNFEYDLAGTPCAQVVGRSFRLVERGVRREFQPNTLFGAKGMDAYAAYPLNDSAGRPLGLVATMSREPMPDDGLAEALLRLFAARAASEIERVRAEQAVRSSEEQYRAIFNASTDALVLWDADYRRVDVNAAYERLYGWTRDEVIGRAYEHPAYPPEYARQRLDLVRRALAGEACHAELEAIRKNGERIPTEFRAIPFEHLGRPHVLTIARDITARKEAEQALRASEEQYRAIFNTAVDGLSLCDPDGRIVDVNAAFVRMTGRERADLVGRDCATIVADEIAEACRAQFAKALAGEPCRGELRMKRVGGGELDVEVRAVAMLYRDRPHVLVSARDLSAEREAERARGALEAQLRQAQKMEAIGHLTGGIAHDFNNLLTTILGYVTLAAETTQDPKSRRYLGEARTASERARDLIAQMLTFSRGRRGDRRPIALGEVAGEVIRLLRSSFPSTVAIATEIEPRLPAVVADPVQVEQVVLNLCINARDAIASRGEIRVRIARAHVEGAACASCRAPVAGDYVELSVEDTGPGISAEVQDRMFDPCFTTKDAGKGTGMGLSTVHGIVHEHGGHVVYERGRDGGARFRVLLPARPGETAQASASLRDAAGFPRAALAGRVMVVDDEPAVAGFVGDLLAEWGMSPRVFHDPRAALDALRADPGAVDLVLSDQTMPGMTGLDLARACRDVPNAPRVVLYTGYAEKVPRGALDASGVAALVRKPIDPPALFATLRTHLRDQ
jgi:PAS domain S-box-containing protein